LFTTIGYIHHQEVHDNTNSHETSIGNESSEEKELDLSNKKGNKNINNCESVEPQSPQRPESSASTTSLSLISNDFNGNNKDHDLKTSCQRRNVTVSYTYDAFFISDGRSRRRNASTVSVPPPPEPKERARYTCTECGKQYATSSNLSRHKQTHRSPDSQLAKKCPTCSKVYVSMPALAMHVVSTQPFSSFNSFLIKLLNIFYSQ
jgi:DNA-directed RNA polymerase subunit RPC12/RpoP